MDVDSTYPANAMMPKAMIPRTIRKRTCDVVSESTVSLVWRGAATGPHPRGTADSGTTGAKVLPCGRSNLLEVDYLELQYVGSGADGAGGTA